MISTEKQEAKAMLKNYKSEDDKLDKKERKARIETLKQIYAAAVGKETMLFES